MKDGRSFLTWFRKAPTRLEKYIQAVMDSPGPSPMTVTATRRSATTTARGFARTAEGHMRILPIRQAGQTAKA